jgi:hypothetical protein
MKRTKSTDDPTESSGQTLASRQCALMSHALRAGEAKREDFFSLIVTLATAYAASHGGGHLLNEMNALLGAGSGTKVPNLLK